MTITRKVGSLLLLLTAGSLIGTATFAVFLRSTAVDFLFFLAANNEERLLQQLYVNNVMIRDGHSDLRATQLESIRDFDALLASMESGGRDSSLGISIIVESVRDLAARPGGTLESIGPEVVRALIEGIPEPPEYLRQRVSTVRGRWLRLKDSFLAVAERPAADPKAVDATAAIAAEMPVFNQASRDVVSAAGIRLFEIRRLMLGILVSIAALSIVLFVLGLLVTRRFIAKPVQRLQTASQRIGAGDFDYRVPIAERASNDELVDLGRTFNKMADEIGRAVGRYRELFENANDFVYTTDLDGTFLTVNKAAEIISGYRREELLQKNFANLMTTEDAALLRSVESMPSEAQLSGVRELRIVSKQGKPISLEDSSRLIYENGMPVGVQGVARDVTERDRMRRQLDTAQRMEAIGRLAGGIAHDFGNVLTIISGYCSLIRGSLKEDDPLREEVDGIQKASQRAESMVRHLLTFSRGQILNRRILNLEKSLMEMTSVLRRLIGENIAFSVNLAPNLGSINFDATQLEQVLVNLALNARDSMSAGGQLRIDATNEDAAGESVHPEDDLPSGSYVRLAVSDTGCGIPPEMLDRIFEPFFSTKTQGTGLGLSTVYSIVHQSGGRVFAESRVGQGTKMTIYLPRVFEAPEADEPPAELTASRERERILLVEDEAEVRRFVQHMLQSAGYSVVEAMDPVDALAICGRPDEAIDLVLTDVVMPNISGPDLAARLKAVRPDLKILFMSGYPRDEFERHHKSGEAVHLIQKPLNSEMLAEKVREVLDG